MEYRIPDSSEVNSKNYSQNKKRKKKDQKERKATTTISL